jgi:hypothetical protein
MKSGRIKFALVLSVLVMLLIFPTVASAKRGGQGGRGDGPVIYVRSQGQYFDSIVTADPLPMKGNFQKLEMGEHGLETDFGPGDSLYQGGRWWLDLNGNNMQDEGDKFFNCPLLGPGRETP